MEKKKKSKTNDVVRVRRRRTPRIRWKDKISKRRGGEGSGREEGVRMERNRLDWRSFCRGYPG